jgi:hypothetical protein
MRGILELLSVSSRNAPSTASGCAAAAAVSGEDPVLMYLWEAVRRIARAIGADAFAPFIPTIIPPLLVAARAETRVTTVRFGPKSDLDSINEAASGGGAPPAADDDEDDEDFVHAEVGYAAVVKVKVRTS